MDIFDVCKNGNIKKILSLIDRGCDGRVVLREVCWFGNIEVVKYLVEKCGVNLRCADDLAVHIASMSGHLEVVKYLVEKCGANVRGDNSGYTIQRACEFGHIEVVQYLVKKCGADARTGNDWPVRLACEAGHFEVVKYLIEKCRAVLPEVNPKYERYLIVYEKGEKKRKCVMAKRIYFWWVQACYNPNSLCGQRSMYKGYREYLSMC